MSKLRSPAIYLLILMLLSSPGMADEALSNRDYPEWRGFTQWSPPAGSSWVPPYIEFTQLDVDVHFDKATGVYTYRYTLNSPVQNRGDIRVFALDIQSLAEGGGLKDAALPAGSKYKRFNAGNDYVNVTIDSPEGWDAAITGGDAHISWRPNFSWTQKKVGKLITPGSSISGFTVYSKAPPGKRSYSIIPRVDMDSPDSPYTIYGESCDGDERSPCPAAVVFDFHGCTLGPVVPGEGEIFSNIGHCAPEAERLMSAHADLKNRIVVPKNKEKASIYVNFGESIIPDSFQATLDGFDVTRHFYVLPNSSTVGTLNTAPGEHVLQLSIDGYLRDGSRASDVDEYTIFKRP